MQAITVAGCALLFGGYALEAVREGFAPVIFAGTGHWIGWDCDKESFGSASP